MRFFPILIATGHELYSGEVDLQAVRAIVHFNDNNFNLLMDNGHWQSIFVGVTDSIEEHWKATREGRDIVLTGTARVTSERRELPPKKGATKRSWE